MLHGLGRDSMVQRWGVLEAKASNQRWISQENPLPGYVNIDTDGSLCNREGKWGAVIRNSEEGPVKVPHGISQYKTVDIIELEGIAQRIALALSNGYEKCVINVGSQTMVHYLIMDNPPWTVRYELGNIKADMGEFQACSLEHCHRETNA